MVEDWTKTLRGNRTRRAGGSGVGDSGIPGLIASALVAAAAAVSLMATMTPRKPEEVEAGTNHQWRLVEAGEAVPSAVVVAIRSK